MRNHPSFLPHSAIKPLFTRPLNAPGFRGASSDSIEIPGYGPVKKAGYHSVESTLQDVRLNQALSGNLDETPRDILIQHARQFIAQESAQKGSGKPYSGACLRLFCALDLMTSQGQFAPQALPYVIAQIAQTDNTAHDQVQIPGYGPVKKSGMQDLAKTLQQLAAEMRAGQSMVDSAIGTLYFIARAAVDSNPGQPPYRYQGEFLTRYNELQLMSMKGEWAHPAMPHLILRLVNPANQFQVAR